MASPGMISPQAGGLVRSASSCQHLRLRAPPRVDQTDSRSGSREDLSRMGDDISAAGLTLAALGCSRLHRRAASGGRSPSARARAGRRSGRSGLRAATGGCSPPCVPTRLMPLMRAAERLPPGRSRFASAAFHR
jgi:hypothetical protein